MQASAEPLTYADRWRALWAAMLGFMLDAMDVMLLGLRSRRYVMISALPTPRPVPSALSPSSPAQEVALWQASSVTSIGRSRTLIGTILIYSNRGFPPERLPLRA